MVNNGWGSGSSKTWQSSRSVMQNAVELVLFSLEQKSPRAVPLFPEEV